MRAFIWDSLTHSSNIIWWYLWLVHLNEWGMIDKLVTQGLYGWASVILCDSGKEDGWCKLCFQIVFSSCVIVKTLASLKWMRMCSIIPFFGCVSDCECFCVATVKTNKRRSYPERKEPSTWQLDNFAHHSWCSLYCTLKWTFYLRLTTKKNYCFVTDRFSWCEFDH